MPFHCACSLLIRGLWHLCTGSVCRWSSAYPTWPMPVGMAWPSGYSIPTVPIIIVLWSQSMMSSWFDSRDMSGETQRDGQQNKGEQHHYCTKETTQMASLSTAEKMYYCISRNGAVQLHPAGPHLCNNCCLPKVSAEWTVDGWKKWCVYFVHESANTQYRSRLHNNALKSQLS